MQIALRELALLLPAQLLGAELEISSVSTDSRAQQPGALFVALVGEYFDGHDFAAEAVARGAAALLVTRKLDLPVPQLLVADSLTAYCRLAGWWRLRWRGRLLAITGSVGKTTTKELCAAILGQLGPTLASRANDNNRIGVAQTLLRLRPEHHYAVVEIGTSTPGEIAASANIAKPGCALLTRLAPAHLEGLGTMANVVQEKSDLLRHLDHNGGAILLRDDEHYPSLCKVAGARPSLSYSLANAEADYFALRWRAQANSIDCTASLAGAPTELELPLVGEHNLVNALGASAASAYLGANPAAIVKGLAQSVAPANRLQVLELGAVRIIADCYNANPASMAAALDYWQQRPEPQKYAVLGDMRELGAASAAEHRKLGQRLGAMHYAGIHGLGPGMQLALAELPAKAKARAHESYEELAAAFLGLLAAAQAQRPSLILIKASRAARFERLIELARNWPSAGG